MNGINELRLDLVIMLTNGNFTFYSYFRFALNYCDATFSLSLQLRVPKMDQITTEHVNDQVGR